jgi:hypothetical protein
MPCVSRAPEHLFDLRPQHQVPLRSEHVKWWERGLFGAQSGEQGIGGQPDHAGSLADPDQALSQHLLLDLTLWRKTEHSFVDPQHRVFRAQGFDPETRQKRADLVARQRRPGVQVYEGGGMKFCEGQHGGAPVFQEMVPFTGKQKSYLTPMRLALSISIPVGSRANRGSSPHVAAPRKA